MLLHTIEGKENRSDFFLEILFITLLLFISEQFYFIYMTSIQGLNWNVLLVIKLEEHTYSKGQIK